MDDFIIIGLLTLIVSGLISAYIFEFKKRSAWEGFFLGLFTGVLGIIIALIISPQNQEITYRDRIASGEMKVCPQCKNIVLTSVNVCPKCGSDVSQVIPRLADLDEKRARKQNKATGREAAKRELILGGAILFGITIIAAIVMALIWIFQ